MNILVSSRLYRVFYAIVVLFKVRVDPSHCSKRYFNALGSDRRMDELDSM